MNVSASRKMPKGEGTIAIVDCDMCVDADDAENDGICLTNCNRRVAYATCCALHAA